MTRFILLLVLATVGCAPRVQLSAPASNASFAERKQAYDALRPMGLSSGSAAESGLMGMAASADQSLVLANQTLVVHPADLLPVVAPNSLSHSLIDSYTNRKRIAGILLGTSLALTLAGTTLVAVDLFNGGDIGGVFIAGSISLIVGLALATVGAIVGEKAKLDRMRAFFQYERDLLDRLGLEQEIRDKQSPRPMKVQDVTTVPVAPLQ